MPSGDLRLSFPLSLFIMSTLSVSLFLALEQSITPPSPEPAPPSQHHPAKVPGATPDQELPHPPKNPHSPAGWNETFYWDHHLNDDNYWNEEETL